MKIAVLSDVHGNLPALEAVLAEITESNFDQVIFLGDLITDFPQFTSNILQTVRAASGLVIRGNREGYLINRAAYFDHTWEDYQQFSTCLKTFQALTGDDIAYLKSLPQQLSVRFNDKYHLRAVHGSPFSEFDVIVEDSVDLNNRSLREITENILVCGHTHRPFIYTDGDKTLINAGSVGLNLDHDQSAQYMVIQVDEDGIQVDLRKAKYDYLAFKKTCDWDDPWIRLSLRTIEDGEDYNWRFLEEAQKRWDVWPIPNDEYNSLFREWCEKGIL